MQNGTKFILVNFGRRLTSVCFQTITSSDKCKLLQEFKIKTGSDYISDIFFEDIRERYVIDEEWNKFRDDHFCDYMNLRRVFDNEKHKFNNTTECVLIEMPTSIIQLMKQNDDQSDKSFVIKDNKIVLSQKTMKEYFRRSLTSLISTIQEIVKGKEEKDIEFVLLLGGYSKSPIVREIIEEGVGQKKIILVYEPDKGVLKGAVMLGFQGNRVEEEIYGTISLREKKKKYSINIEYEGHNAYFLKMFRSSQLKDRKSITCELQFEDDEKNKPIVFYRIDSAKIEASQPLTEKDFEKVVPEIQPRNCVWNDREKVEISMTENGVVVSVKEMQNTTQSIRF
jgi:molecular chaperone DnaK (HSP70)